MQSIYFIVCFLHYLIGNGSCHSDHLPGGLLPGSGNPWDIPSQSRGGILNKGTGNWNIPAYNTFDISKGSGSRRPLIDSGGKVKQVIELRMPSVRPNKEDEYLCTAFEISDEKQYILKFEALATVKVVHHMLLFGCTEPYSDHTQWKCGPVCKRGSQRIIYAWARNAPPTVVPKDVGFEVSGDSGTQYLVLQIHYKQPLSPTEKADTSGMRITITNTPQPYIAGIYLLASRALDIPPNTPKIHGDISCRYDGAEPLYPIAFRTHTHDLGVVVTGYKFNGQYEQLGKGNPQWPQAFYPVKKQMEINAEDIIIGRCTFNSTGRNRMTKIGSTHNDEMCNFYLMFYTSAARGSSYYSCSDNLYPDTVTSLPPDSDTPLPFNPALESIAEGGGMASTLAPQQYNNNQQPPHNYYNQNNMDSQQQQQQYPSYQLYNRDSIYNNNNRSPPNPRTLYDNPAQMRGNNGMEGAFFPADDLREGYIPRRRMQLNLRSRQNQQQQQRSNQLWQGEEVRGEVGRLGGGRVDTSSTTFKRTKGRQNLLSNLRNPSNQQPGLRMNPKMSPQFKGQSDRVKNQNANKAKDSYLSDFIGDEEAVQIDPTWKIAGGNIHIGQIGGIATDSKGNIHVFHRATRKWDYLTFDARNRYIGVNNPIVENTVLTFDPKGKLIHQWGKNMFFMPHGLHIDQHDRVWLTDVALHQVFRFPVGSSTPDLTLGTRFSPGSDRRHFCKPSDLAVLENGDFFVADGYCNARIVKFSANGTFLMSWGNQSTSVGADGYPPVGTFSLPHGLTLLPDLSWLCVADRMNGRIQCFDYYGAFMIQIHPEQFNGVIFGLSYSLPDGVLYAINGPNVYNTTKSNTIKGFTIDPQNGVLMESWGPLQGFKQPHDVAVTSQGQYVYVGELEDNKLWRFSVRQELIRAFTSHRTVKKDGVHPKEPKPQSSQPPPSPIKGVTELGNPIKQDGGLPMLPPPSDKKTSIVSTVLESVPQDSKALEQINSADGTEQALPGSGFGVSLLIGALLVIPVLLIVLITVFVRLYKAGKLPRFMMRSGDYHNRRFNLGGILTSNKGFTSLNMTEDTSELDHLNSDSEVEEFNATPMKA